MKAGMLALFLLVSEPEPGEVRIVSAADAEKSIHVVEELQYDVEGKIILYEMRCEYVLRVDVERILLTLKHWNEGLKGIEGKLPADTPDSVRREIGYDLADLKEYSPGAHFYAATVRCKDPPPKEVN
jgi:hypothetical protein